MWTLRIKFGISSRTASPFMGWAISAAPVVTIFKHTVWWHYLLMKYHHHYPPPWNPSKLKPLLGSSLLLSHPWQPPPNFCRCKLDFSSLPSVYSQTVLTVYFTWNSAPRLIRAGLACAQTHFLLDSEMLNPLVIHLHAIQPSFQGSRNIMEGGSEILRDTGPELLPLDTAA